MKTIRRPKGWVKADAVRVVRKNGRYEVQIRRKPKKRKSNPKNKARGCYDKDGYMRKGMSRAKQARCYKAAGRTARGNKGKKKRASSRKKGKR